MSGLFLVNDSVVILLKHPCHLFLAHPIVLRHQFDVLAQGGSELLLGNAADGSKLWVHGDIAQVVDSAEDAELRELGDSRDEANLMYSSLALIGA